MDKLVAWQVVGSKMPIACAALRSAWARLVRISECDAFGYSGMTGRTRSSMLHDFVVQALENSADLGAAHDTVNQLDVFRFHHDGSQVGLRIKKTDATGNLTGENHTRQQGAWRGDSRAALQLDLPLLGVDGAPNSIPPLSEAIEAALLTFGYDIDEGWSGISEVLLVCHNAEDVAWSIAMDLSTGACLDTDIAEADAAAAPAVVERRPRFRPRRPAAADEGAGGAER